MSAICARRRINISQSTERRGWPPAGARLRRSAAPAEGRVSTRRAAFMHSVRRERFPTCSNEDGTSIKQHTPRIQRKLLPATTRSLCGRWLLLQDRKRTENRMIRGIQNYVINVVPRYTDTQFKEHFRMDRSTFEVLLQITQERLNTERTPRIPFHTKVLMALWLLGNQVSFRDVADRFGVNKGLLHYVVNNIIELWAGTAPDFIQWPLSLQDVAHEFYRK
ncbi:uncharacterized protein [Dermacentor albipictus]|uniref:uncharacterized protein n=1 Tax=Dermacentor albipictus TaxID=60249 RepID=UPI0038FCC781